MIIVCMAIISMIGRWKWVDRQPRFVFHDTDMYQVIFETIHSTLIAPDVMRDQLSLSEPSNPEK